MQHSLTSSFFRATRLLRTSKHNSRASTHVLTYLKRLSVCSRSFCRLTSKFVASPEVFSLLNSVYGGFYSFVNSGSRCAFILCLSLLCATPDRVPYMIPLGSRYGSNKLRELMIHISGLRNHKHKMYTLLFLFWDRRK